jgi:hypothetical protein
MNKIYSFLFLLGLTSIPLLAQPTYSVNPPVFTAEDEITLTVNVANTSLANYGGNVWIWSWIAQGCSASCDAPTNINPASSPGADAALMTRDSDNPNVYSITLVLQDFFGKAPAEIQKFGLKLKSQDWGDGKQTDSDIVISVQPLVFTASVNRVFPSKVGRNDVVSLYLHQPEASSPALKYQVGSFSVEVKAYDAEGAQVGSTIIKDAVNKGSGVHVLRIVPTHNFGVSTMTKVTYQFISKVNSDVKSDVFEAAFLDLN